jgi:hypothetical protein
MVVRLVDYFSLFSVSPVSISPPRRLPKKHSCTYITAHQEREAGPNQESTAHKVGQGEEGRYALSLSLYYTTKTLPFFYLSLNLSHTFPIEYSKNSHVYYFT